LKLIFNFDCEEIESAKSQSGKLRLGFDKRYTHNQLIITSRNEFIYTKM